MSMQPLIKLIIQGRIPSKKNSRCLFVRHGKLMNIPSKQYTAWHKEATKHLDQSLVKCLYEIDKIELFFYAPDKRASDLSNKTESVMDFLVDNCIILNDNWNIVPELHLYFKGVDKLNPRCEVFIYGK